MSKRDRHLKQRLNELFSPAADESQPAAPASEPSVQAKRAARASAAAAAAPVDLPYLAAAINQLSLPAYIKDREHTWVALNTAFAQLLGQTPAALVGRTDKEQADEIWQLDDRVLESGHEEISQETSTLPDGTLRTRRTRRTPLKSEDQTTRFVMGVVEELPAQVSSTHPHVPESAETFHAALDAVPSPVIISRIADDVILYANQAFSTFTGLPLAQLLGQRAVSFYADPADREHVVQGVRQQGELHGFDVRMRRADGSTFWVSLSIRRLKFNAEACVITTLEDIADRKQAEQELAKFKLGIDRAYYSVMITAVDGTILYVNPAFTKIYGYLPEEAIGRKPSLLKSGAVTPEQYARFWNKLLSGEIVTGEIINKTRDGRLIPVETNNSPILDESGQLMGFISMQSDISARKQGEAELRKFQQGLEHSTSAIFITDRAGVITYVNPAFEKIYGFTRTEAIGQTPRIIKSGLIPPEQYRHFWATLLAGQTVAGEITNKAKDGRLIPIEGSNNPILDESGNIVGFLALHTDISARKQAEEDLVTRNRQLATFNRVGQELAQLVTPQEVVEHVYTAIGEVFDNHNLYIALYDERKQEISFPIYTMDGERRTVAGRPFGNGMTEHVLRTKKALWIPRDVPQFAASIGVVSIGRSSQCYLGVPLLSGDKALGVIAVQDYEHEDIYTTADVELLSAIAAQTAAALENVRLYAAESRRAVQLQTAAEISTAAGTVLNIDELLPVVVDLIQQRFSLYYVGLFLVDELQQNAVLRAGTGEAGRRMLERQHQLALDDRSMIGWCIRQRVPRIALDVGEDAVRFSNPDLPETRSELALPLVSRGEVVGAMTVQSTEAAAFSEQDIAILQTMSDQVATAIANAQLFEEAGQARQQAEARLRETQFLQSVGQTVSSSLDLSFVLDLVMNALQDDMGFTHNALYLVDRKAGTVTTPRAVGTASQLLGLTRTLQQLRGDILLDILEQGKIDVIDGWDDRLDRDIYESQGHAELVRAFVPLRLRGESIGLLEVGYRRAERARITPEEVRLLSGLADQIAIAVENARLLEQAQTALAETTRRSEQLDVLNEMARALGSSLNADAIFNTVYTYTSRLMDTQNFFIAVYDQERKEISFPLSYSYNDSRPVQVESRPLKSGLTDYVIRQRQPLLLAEDIPAGMAKLGLEFLAFGNAQPALSWLGVPMTIGEQVLGAIVVQSITTPNLYRELERELLLAVAGQAAIALNNAYLFGESQQRITELAVVNEISRILTVTQDVKELFATIHQQVGRLYDVANFYIATYDSGDEWSLDYQFEHGQLLPPARHKLGGGFTSYILQTRKSILIRSSEDNLAFHDQQNLPKIGETAKSWMGVPLIVGGSIIGVMGIQSYEEERLYGEQDVALFSIIASQVAAAIQNARLFQQARLRATELTALNELSQTLAAQLNVRQVLEEVWHGVSRLLDTTNFYIALYDRERQEIAFPINASESVLDKEIEVMPADQGLTGYIIRTRQPLLISEDTDRRVQELGLANIGGTSQSYLGVPLILGDEVLGVMAIQSYTRTRLYNEHDQNLMLSIAGQAAIALQNARLFEQTQKQARETAAINEILQDLSQRRTLDEILETAYRHIHELVPSDACIVAMHEAGTNRLWYPLIYDNDQRYPAREGDITASTNISQVITAAEPVLIHRTPQDVERIGGGALAALGNLDRPSASLLYVPLKSEQKVIGALSVQSYQLNAYTAEHISLLTRIANQLGVAVQNIQLFEQIQRNAGQLVALNELGQAVSQQIEIDQVLEATYQQLQPLVPVDAFFVALYDRDAGMLSFPIMYDEGQRYAEHAVPFNPNSSTGQVILTGEPRLKLLTADELAATTEVPGGLGNVNKPSASLLYVPLFVGNQTIGALSIQSYQLNAYSHDTLQLMGNVANQVAIAIQNARLFNEAQQRSSELATLNQIISSAAQTLDLRTLLDTVLRQTLDVFGFDGGLITVYNESRGKLERVVRTGLPGRIPDDPAEGLENSLCNYVFEAKAPLVIEDFRAGAPLDVSGEIEAGYYSYIGIPLEARGRMLGTWCGFRKLAGPFGKNTLALLQAVSRQLSFAIENAYLFNAARARARREQTLREITSRVRSSIEPDAIARTAVRELGIALGRQTFIRLGDAAQLSQPPHDDQTAEPASGNGHPASLEGGQ